MAEGIDGKKARKAERARKREINAQGETPSPFAELAQIRDSLPERTAAIVEEAADAPAQVISDAVTETVPAAEEVSARAPEVASEAVEVPTDAAVNSAAEAEQEAPPGETSAENGDTTEDIDVDAEGREFERQLPKGNTSKPVFDHYIWNASDGSAILKDRSTGEFHRRRHGEAYEFRNKDGEARVQYYDASKNNFYNRPPRAEIQDPAEREASAAEDAAHEARRADFIERANKLDWDAEAKATFAAAVADASPHEFKSFNTSLRGWEKSKASKPRGDRRAEAAAPIASSDEVVAAPATTPARSGVKKQSKRKIGVINRKNVDRFEDTFAATGAARERGEENWHRDLDETPRRREISHPERAGLSIYEKSINPLKTPGQLQRELDEAKAVMLRSVEQLHTEGKMSDVRYKQAVEEIESAPHVQLLGSMMPGIEKYKGLVGVSTHDDDFERVRNDPQAVQDSINNTNVDEHTPRPSAAGKSLETDISSEPRRETGPESGEDRLVWYTQVHVATSAVVDQIKAGIDPNRAYMNQRRKLQGEQIKMLDAQLKEEESLLGVPLGIHFGEATPAERLRKTSVPPHAPPEQPTIPKAPGQETLPSWAGGYLAGQHDLEGWRKRGALLYGDLAPFTIDAIRSDAHKEKLFGEFMIAVDPTQRILETIAANEPLSESQRDFLEYCQYEFTFQYGRAERIKNELSADDFRALMRYDKLLDQTAQMSGHQKLLSVLKQDMFHLAVHDKATFQRLNLAIHELKHQSARRFKIHADNERKPRAAIAEIMGARLRESEVQRALQQEAFTGATDGSGEQVKAEREKISTQMTVGNLQQWFDKAKVEYATQRGKTWEKMSESERTDFRNNVWSPPEMKKAKKELGFWAQLSEALAQMFFNQEKKKVSVH